MQEALPVKVLWQGELSDGQNRRQLSQPSTVVSHREQDRIAKEEDSPQSVRVPSDDVLNTESDNGLEIHAYITL